MLGVNCTLLYKSLSLRELSDAGFVSRQYDTIRTELLGSNKVFWEDGKVFEIQCMFLGRCQFGPMGLYH